MTAPTADRERAVRLPFPPSANNMFRELSPEARAKIAAGMRRKGKKGRPPTRAISTRYKHWRKEATVLLTAAGLPRYCEPVIVKLALHPPDARRRDADNFSKPVLDALVTAGVIPDDSSAWVKAVIPYWEPPSDDAHVLVTIRPAKEQKPGLNANERRTLARIKEKGIRFVSVNYHPSKGIRGLVEKGYLAELPGLLDDFPQGYVIV